VSRLVVQAQTPSLRSDDMTRLLHVAGPATTSISHRPAAADTRYTCGAAPATCLAPERDTCELVP